MARITVEDCLFSVDNQFELVLLAAKRARRIANGATPLVPAGTDKPTVVALREIAEGLVTRALLLEQDPPPEQNPADYGMEIPSDFRAPQLGLGD